MTTLVYRSAASIPVFAPATLTTYESVLFALMLRNVASAGWVLIDASSNRSLPGAIVASPSYPTNDSDTTQIYTFNWTRDAAITAFEIAAAPAPWTGIAAFQDYVTFAQTCQQTAVQSGVGIGYACYQVNGPPRQSWTLPQNDGPALQTLALLALWPNLTPASQTIAAQLIQSNIAYLLPRYASPTVNLWEEATGLSFFAQSVILQCFTTVLAQNAGLNLGLDAAALTAAITALNDPGAGVRATFWNAANARYASMKNAVANETGGPYAGSDINADVVMASVYGAISSTDPQLLSSAAQVRSTFVSGADPFPINSQDAQRAPPVGPMIGRYPGDDYDGDTDSSGTDHPWAPCTANFAQLYYNVAVSIQQANALPTDPLATNFFAQVGVTATTPASTAVSLLQTAGDQMLQALLFHSDFLELGEQFDGATGYEKGVRNLTWSYASFLSALRARSQIR